MNVVDSDNSRSSHRANVLERKRLEQVFDILENAKLNLAIDLRKSQANYRRQLQIYRHRQRQIVMSRSNSLLSESDVLPVSPRNVISRADNRAKTGEITPRSNDVGGDVNPEEHAHTKDDVGKTPAVTSLPSDEPFVTKLSPASRTIQREATVTLGSNSPRREKNTAKVSPYTAKVPTAISFPPLQPKPKGENKLSPLTKPTSQSGKDNSRDEYTDAILEIGKMSSRQRSKLDLRPRTAWTLLVGAGEAHKPDDQKPVSPVLPVVEGRIGDPKQQVRYFEKDEIEERGTFYNFLVQGRLQREQTRFRHICEKINGFCTDFGSRN
ncbi:uncharacterized protein LOC131956920 [Physella acuta]|uniref:uncharacterized protein LOC131956920 n=1 Tax=Physella acuta TaxID=109671 RepID=UPI0027DC1768|nr:uncharacterized protein LOC131956920 [Physella acuta]